MDSHYLNEVLKGNTKAFGYFIKTYQNKAFSIAFSIVKQEEDAKDVVQDSFIAAYTRISKFRNEARFSTWLYRIVVNTSLKHIDKQKRNDRMNESYSASVPFKGEPALNLVLRQMHRDELRDLIKQVLQKIPPKQALILQLYYIEEHSIEEIKSITAFTSAHIKVLLHRGRASFYHIMKTYNIEKPY